MNISDKCEYGFLFKKTYWNGITIDDYVKTVIVENRDRFAVDYKLKQFISRNRPERPNEFFDHCEQYTSELGSVYIVSPYHINYDAYAESIGFSRYLKLYHKDANTYIRVFEKGDRLRKFFNELDKNYLDNNLIVNQ